MYGSWIDQERRTLCSDRELDLLLFYWRRWNYRSIPECALNTWLSRELTVNLGLTVKIRLIFGDRTLTALKRSKLPDKSGFGFLPADSEVALDFRVKLDCASFSG